MACCGAGTATSTSPPAIENRTEFSVAGNIADGTRSQSMLALASRGPSSSPRCAAANGLAASASQERSADVKLTEPKASRTRTSSRSWCTADANASTALRGAPAAELAALAEATLAGTEATWRALLADLSRRELGGPAERLRARDLPRLLRTTAPPAAFPAARLLPDAEQLLIGLGLDLAAGGRLTVDAAPRPGKIARPLAVVVEAPGAVRLSLAPLAALAAMLVSAPASAELAVGAKAPDFSAKGALAGNLLTLRLSLTNQEQLNIAAIENTYYGNATLTLDAEAAPPPPVPLPAGLPLLLAGLGALGLLRRRRP